MADLDPLPLILEFLENVGHGGHAASNQKQAVAMCKSCIAPPEVRDLAELGNADPKSRTGARKNVERDLPK
eukprot:819228-Alexandrium_andersonii.AAC.1